MSDPVIKRPPAHWEKLASMGGVELWRYGGFIVSSQLAMANAPQPPREPIPTWMIGISRNGRRPTDDEVARALRAFSMQDAIEDNHEPGVKRMYFLPIDPSRRADCECKTDEVLVTEADGYQWSNAIGKNDCRGCEYQRKYGKPCPVHSDGGAGVTLRAPAKDSPL